MTAISGPVCASSDIDSAVAELAREPGGGLVVLPDAFTNTHRTVIFELAMRYRLPAVYTFGHFAVEGGLIAYGVNIVTCTGDQHLTSIESSRGSRGRSADPGAEQIRAYD